MIRTSIVKSKRLSAILRGVLAALALVLVVLIFMAYEEGAWKEIFAYYRFFLDYKNVRNFILSFGHFASVAFVFLQALQVVFAPIPGEITGFVGGLIFGNVLGVVYSTVGLTLGSLLAFTISRKLGLKFVERIVKKQYIDKFNFFVTHRGLKVSFILFLIPGFPKDSLCYLLGLTRLRTSDFIMMNIFGRLPGTIMLTMQGTALHAEQYRYFFILLLVSVVLTFVLYLARNGLVQGFVSTMRKLGNRLRGKNPK